MSYNNTDFVPRTVYLFHTGVYYKHVELE